eukprot:249858-Pleurochrysis_carterae.AAC.1
MLRASCLWCSSVRASSCPSIPFRQHASHPLRWASPPAVQPLKDAGGLHPAHSASKSSPSASPSSPLTRSWPSTMALW